MASRPRSIFLLDDSPALRAGLRSAIDSCPDLQVVGEAARPADALPLLLDLRPALILTDIHFDGVLSLAHFADFRAQLPTTALLVLTSSLQPVLGERLLRIGARGVLSKQEPLPQIITAIKHVLAGKVHASAPVMARLLHRFGHDIPGAAQDPHQHLSLREQTVLGLVGSGASTTAIAARLGISSKTVQTYYGRIRLKLKLRCHAELIQYAGLCQVQPRTRPPE